MKIVISPAKSLDYESTLPTNQSTISCFLKEANTINRQLKKQKPKQLMELMDISDKLADLNWQRNQERDLDNFTPENSRQAIYAFNGDVYIGLDIKTLPTEKLDVLQDKLRILSGFWGAISANMDRPNSARLRPINQGRHAVPTGESSAPFRPRAPPRPFGLRFIAVKR